MTRPTSAKGRLARFGFTNAAAAGALLGPAPAGLGLWDEAEQRPVGPDGVAILTALGGAADPDLAVRQLHRIAEAAQRAAAGRTAAVDGIAVDGAAVDPVARMRTDAEFRAGLCAVLGACIPLGDDLVADPGRLTALASPVEPMDPFAGAGIDSPAALRVAYRGALLRIAAADLTHRVGIEVTMGRLSQLADATVAAALELSYKDLQDRQGTQDTQSRRDTQDTQSRQDTQDRPARVRPRLAVIAMGKCGGQELNYVSDVDVIFVCAADEDLTDSQVVAARMMGICGQVAWPVDANLRPEGSHGPLVRTLAAHLAYYTRWARTWEFQALLKARPAAGDLELGRQWLAAVSPLIWRAAERPEAVDDVRAMRRRIIENVPVRERDREIKRGPGGLRDIEFAVQLLQLVHGRGDDELRTTSTLDGLRALIRRGYVGRHDGEALVAAYQFLRMVEHRLQLQRLRRTHTVPDERTPDGAAALRWLAHAMGMRSQPHHDAVQRFRAAWVAHAQEVRRLHAKLVYRPLVQAVARVPGEALRLTPDAARQRLEILGFRDPAAALRHIEALTGGVSRNAAIQHTLLPVLLDEFADAPEPDRGLLAYRQVSDALRTTPWFLRLLRDEGPVALRLARLLGWSRYVAELLARDPEALRLIAEDAQLVPRTRQSLVESLESVVDRWGLAATDGGSAGGGSADQAGQAVRALRRRELFRIAAADLLGAMPGEVAPAGGRLDLLGVGQALSDVTDATLNAALRAAQATVYAASGSTTGNVSAALGSTSGNVSAALGSTAGAGALGSAHVESAPSRVPFAIIGMGRLGGSELSYASDADVLFVYEPVVGLPEDQAGAIAHQIAEEVRRLLSVPSAEPPLAIDVDLRPEGRQGPLARSLAAYERYYAGRSRVWEAQALLRARFVCGDEGLGARFIALADRVRYPAAGLTDEQIIDIRRIKARVDAERLPRRADPATHAKLGWGGLADVEWAVQLLQLRYANSVVGLRTPRTLAALAAALEAGLVTTADAAALAAGWTMASRVRNALMLVRGRASDQLPRHGTELAGVSRALGHPGGTDPGEFLDEYLRTARHTRTAAERVLLQ